MSTAVVRTPDKTALLVGMRKTGLRAYVDREMIPGVAPAYE